MSATILYKDIAPGAAENAVATSSSVADFANLSTLTTSDNTSPKATFEVGGWGLDGESVGAETAAYWSAAVSGSDGQFAVAPTITITFSEQFSSTGITLVFPTDDYCKDINIKWYRNNNLRHNENFVADESTVFCRLSVENFDKIVITLQSTSLPYRSAKLNRVFIGTYRSFGIDELRSVQIANECDLITTKLPASQLRWTLDSNTDVDYMFQMKQTVEARLDDKLVCVYYVTEADRKGARLYDVTCQDAFGVLESISFAGAKYDNISATTLFRNLIGNRFPLYITARDRTLSGVILPGNLREAVRQVLFAWGVCASTDGCDGIRVFDLSSEEKEIPLNRTFSGVTVKKEAAVTKVNVTGHTYTQDENGEVEINGIKYRDDKTIFSVINPTVTPSDMENVVDVTSATMVSTLTGQRTARGVYNWYEGKSKTEARILWNNEKLGDMVRLHNEWGGTEYGCIEKLQMTFSNTLIASITVRKIDVAEGNYFSGEVFAGEVDS